jgi:enoyl-CoA hydratase/carnithine racemase
MTSFKHLKISYSGDGVADVRLARPPANAVDGDMYIEIASLFSAPDMIGPNLQAIVLSGEGNHFCAGNDLDEFGTMTPENGTERMWRVREAFFAIQDCPVPVIAAVHGAALGTGLCLAVSSDVILATKDARFGLPELTVGVMGGARHLARVVPQALVRRMYLTGEPISGEELAAATGAIITCEREQLLERAHGIARRIAGFSPKAVRLSKMIMNRIETMDIKAGYAFEQGYTVEMSGHPDSKEALTAFREKRAPIYRPLDSVESTAAA